MDWLDVVLRNGDVYFIWRETYRWPEFEEFKQET